MKTLSTVLLCLFLTAITTAQTNPLLRPKGELRFGDEPERIVAVRSLEKENKLVLVGTRTVRILDVEVAKFVDSHPLETPAIFGEDNPPVISPDGRKLLLFGNYTSHVKQDKVKRPPSVWDLQTGKLIAELRAPKKSIKAGLWSSNGKILVTSSDKYAPLMVDDISIEVSFWDGETGKFRNSLPAERINWWRITADGEKCFYSTGPVKNLLFISKYLGNNGGPIRIWDIETGQTETTVSSNEDGVEKKISKISISPDEKYLTFIAQKPKSKDTERSLIVWEIDQNHHELKPKYEIKANSKIEDGARFSPDGKYFSLLAGKSLRVYDTSSGQQRFELTSVRSNPDFWLDENRIILYAGYSAKMTALETATGKPLYEQDVVYTEYQYTAGSGEDTYIESGVSDRTTVVVNPNRDLLLTYSKQFVKVSDSKTGEILQTLVSPPMDYTKKKPRVSDKPLVSKAAWSADGNTLYVIDADERSISLWALPPK